jgi:shikimate kinase
LSKNILVCEPEFDFEVISLVSSVKDYRLCWLLNTQLNMDFTRVDDLIIQQTKRKGRNFFTTYGYYDEINKMNYFLITNKFEGNLLLPELKTVDYILKLEGFLATEKKEELLDELKHISYLEAVFGNQINELKNKANLLF